MEFSAEYVDRMKGKAVEKLRRRLSGEEGIPPRFDQRDYRGRRKGDRFEIARQMEELAEGINRINATILRKCD